MISKTPHVLGGFMYLDLAPLEGITGAIFRRLHHEYFPGVDRYYTPFISPTADRVFTPKEQREIFPEYNRDIPLIPQLLTKSADDFLWAANELHAMGYDEVNLNVGCPSGTVTAKGKGSGMLADLQNLQRFLDVIFEKAPGRISIKTRLGLAAAEEFEAVLALYNQYPISELVVHPRVRKDFYRHPVRNEAFDKAYRNRQIPITYNGSIIAPQDYIDCAERYPALRAIMIGQGLISDPFLAGKIKYGTLGDKQLLEEFHDRLFDGYAQQFQSRNNAAKRMKEIWFYLIRSFDDSERYGKRILKAKDAAEYDTAVKNVFSQLQLLERSTGGW